MNYENESLATNAVLGAVCESALVTDAESPIVQTKMLERVNYVRMRALDGDRGRSQVGGGDGGLPLKNRPDHGQFVVRC